MKISECKLGQHVDTPSGRGIIVQIGTYDLSNLGSWTELIHVRFPMGHAGACRTYQAAELTEVKSKYTVGRTTHNAPCVLVDGDSVFAIFPSVPNGEKHAQVVCDLLNERES